MIKIGLHLVSTRVGMQKICFCRLPNGIYKITSDANDEQKWV